MKTSFTAIIMIGFASVVGAQDMGKVMETRAREMFRVIGVSDRDQWKKFITENYSQALIDKAMHKKTQNSEEGTVTASTEETPANNLEAKVKMIGTLHEDFGGSKLISLKPAGETIEMVLSDGSGFTGTFKLTFDKTKPYLIAALGIEVRGQQ